MNSVSLRKSSAKEFLAVTPCSDTPETFGGHYRSDQAKALDDIRHLARDEDY